MVNNDNTSVVKKKKKQILRGTDSSPLCAWDSADNHFRPIILSCHKIFTLDFGRLRNILTKHQPPHALALWCAWADLSTYRKNMKCTATITKRCDTFSWACGDF